MFYPRIQRRNSPEELATRAAAVAVRGLPESLDEEGRSVEVVAATETPARVYDYERWAVVDEVLLMSGLDPLPSQVPYLNAHSRFETSRVLGSARDFRVEGESLICRPHFSTTPAAEEAWTLTREGHLTDVSVGYQVHAYQWVEPDKTAVINGKSYTGPVKVVTKWQVKEVSAVPIGADDQAKVRAENNQPKEMKMDKHLRAWLEARGLSKDASDKEAWRFYWGLGDEQRAEFQPEAAPPPASGDGGRADAANAADHARADAGPDDAARAAVRAERDRVAEIRALGRTHGLEDEQIDGMIDRGVPVSDAQREVLDILARRSPETADGAGHRGIIQMGPDEVDKFRSAAADGLLLRAGIAVEQPAAGSDEIRGYTLRELARECLRRSRRASSGRAMEMVGRALTTSDLPIILGQGVQRSLLRGFEQAEETWNIWCGTGSVSDFKTHKIGRASETQDLEEIPEGAEYQYDKMEESFESYAVVTYGKILAVTRQAIINDDLGALTEVPRKHGEAVSRKIGDVAYAVLTANAAMGDGTALFHADHSNLVASGSGGAPALATLNAAYKAMATQTDISEVRRLNIRPHYFLAPWSLWGSSETFFGTLVFGATDTNPGLKNPFANRIPEASRVYEPRLDDDNATAWYLAGAKGKTVTVFFMDGQQRPYTEQKGGWNVDGTEFKVRIDCGAKAVDWRALYKNYGA